MPKTTDTQAQLEDLFGFGDIVKIFQRFNIPGVDMGAIIEAQQKDMQALADANREAYEGIKALVARRNEMFQEALTRWQKSVTDTAGNHEAMERQVEVAKKGIETAVDNFRELVEMEAAAQGKAWKIIRDRFEENLKTMQSLLHVK
ncbi:MAG TPA: phasin family protein [Nevskiaceae bacterium]